ncbi:MAG: carboxypeptidase regulatory-like domain-containing protein, partial [Planctomycetota bacterium]
IPLLHTSWRADQTGVTSSARCDADGRFELHAPAGMYLLRCTSGARTHCEGVTVPTSAPLVIDFARAASLVVQLRDRHGAPVAGYVIALQSADGRSTGHMSDVDGRVEFADLSAGDYTLAVAPKPGVWSWGRSQNQPIALRDGEQRVLELTLPAGDPRYAQLFVEGAADTTGWRARDGSLPDQAWTDVRADGVIPIDIRSGIWMLDIENAPQQRWEVFIPEDAPDGFPIHIEIAERGYEGRVVQYGTSKPARGMRITAVPRGLYSPERTLTSVVTDEDGRFRLAGLEADRFALELTRSDQLGHRYGETNRVRFVPDEAPSTPPRVLTIGVPSQSDGHWSGFAERKVSGQVRLAGRDGAGITVEIEAHIATADGHLSIRHSLARGNSDENGKYALTSLVATSYSATLFDAKSRKVSQTFEWSTSSGSDVEVHNFEFE